MSRKNYSGGPLMIFQSFWRSRQIIWALTKRDIIGRYRGSMVGIFWSLLSPLLMLVVYTFVFGVVFKARWGTQEESFGEFGIMLFTGMIVFAIFAECVTRAPNLILSNTNYVKKVVFPLESLPWSSLGSALFHALMSTVVLLLMHLVIFGKFPWTIILFPIVISPILLITIGLSWFLASLGVFLRDLGQIVGIFTTAIMFLSAIFYPPSALPKVIQPYVLFSPLTFAIEEARSVLIRGHGPNWGGLGINLVIGVLVAWLGLLWFERTRHGFADVI